MKDLVHISLVAGGGAIGAVLRHLAGLVALRLGGPAFPWGTLFVNVAGSLAMGLLVGWLARRSGGAEAELRLFLATGVLGGFTTFSAFSLDIVALVERGAAVTGAAYALGSVLLGVAALVAGLAIARSFA